MAEMGDKFLRGKDKDDRHRNSHQSCSKKSCFSPVLEPFFNKVAGHQAIRPATLLKRDSDTGLL